MLALNKNNKVTKVSGEAARGVERGESACCSYAIFSFSLWCPINLYCYLKFNANQNAHDKH